MSASNNKNMKWVNVTYERNVRHINKGKFLTNHDPEMVKRWLHELQLTSDISDSDSFVESITQSPDWEETNNFRRLNCGSNIEFVIDENYSGEGEMDNIIQSWIDTKRVDITSIYATGHDPLEIQEFLKEHQEIFNKMVTRKTIYDLKEDEGNLYCSLRKLVGLEDLKQVGSGRNTFNNSSIFSQIGFYTKWKDKKEDEEVEETCEVS